MPVLPINIEVGSTASLDPPCRRWIKIATRIPNLNTAHVWKKWARTGHGRSSKGFIHLAPVCSTTDDVADVRPGLLNCPKMGLFHHAGSPFSAKNRTRPTYSLPDTTTGEGMNEISRRRVVTCWVSCLSQPVVGRETAECARSAFYLVSQAMLLELATLWSSVSFGRVAREAPRPLSESDDFKAVRHAAGRQTDTRLHRFGPAAYAMPNNLSGPSSTRGALFPEGFSCVTIQVLGTRYSVLWDSRFSS
ncbi:hypothetical protein LX32DRAFT_265120 [Colletotrichum zoysiae]|uniref:Uncharacterized protein n=1 Tax=Colletotrichum zoysiae TaxID=1216348 RepID=A0AAD9H2I1_9PEZI|nr:hypothetical protein LX32DRAFT_265120 [Colletotrichum zoysiae]